MRLLNLVLVLILVLGSLSPTEARRRRKKKSKKHQPAVVAAPRIEPLRDPKVLAQFTNSGKISDHVNELDAMDKAALQKELTKIKSQREKQARDLKALRRGHAKVQNRRAKLQETKALLKQQGLEPNSFSGLYHRLGFFVKDTQLKQVKAEEKSVQARADKAGEALRLTSLYEDYIQSKI